MKPVELVERAIQNSSKRGNFVLDQFGGSGTTLIACENTGRTCYMMELDPKYADVIVRRYAEKAGGNEVFLLRDGQKTAYTALQDSLDLCAQQSDECAETITPVVPQTLESSSTHITYVSGSHPCPPYSLGTAIPRKPFLAILSTVSRGNLSFSSTSCARGFTSFSANS